MKTKDTSMIGTAINSKSIVAAFFLLGTIPSLIAQDREGRSRGGEGRGGNGGGRENHAQSTPNTTGGTGQAYPNNGGQGRDNAGPSQSSPTNQNNQGQGRGNAGQAQPSQNGGQGRGQVQTYPNNGQARGNDRYENRERDNRDRNNNREHDNRGWNNNRGQAYPQQRGGYNNGGYNNRTVIINRQQHVYNNAPNWRYNNLPRRNAICQSLPSASLSINFGGFSFWYSNGIYYKPYNNSYIVAPAPVGIRVQYLPQDCRRIFIQNRPYFYYYGTYYEYNGYDYAVVPPPIGALVESIPDGYEQLVINGDTFFIVDGVQYKAVIYNGEIWYEVIKIDYRR
ncbi:MAG: DUF6515 family protein [Flectobacillus sp.]|nr:DUF6515 family protein [Flectobacillus sp.]